MKVKSIATLVCLGIIAVIATSLWILTVTQPRPLPYGAAGLGWIGQVERYLNEGRDIDGKSPKEGWTMLMTSARGGHLNIVKYLVEKGAALDVASFEDCTALDYAAGAGQPHVVKYLLNKGANIEGIGGNYTTPLGWASFFGHRDIVEYLVEQGANINAKDRRGVTPVIMATSNGHNGIADYLRSKGAQ
jgi:uncharacterized protein